MRAHVDILDEEERIRGPIWASILFHLGLAGLMVGLQVSGIGKRVQWGDPTGGGMGSVMISPVNSIPLPSRATPMNPVANNTESAVPAPPPAKAKSQPKAKAPDPNAI